MEEHLTMGASERDRLKLFERVKRDELSLTEASEIGGLSYRQTRRMYKRYREDGDRGLVHRGRGRLSNRAQPVELDRKSTRLNSSHSQISYAVFCLKKKKKKTNRIY